MNIEKADRKSVCVCRFCVGFVLSVVDGVDYKGERTTKDDWVIWTSLKVLLLFI